MKQILLLAALAPAWMAQAASPILLWPGNAPGEQAALPPEMDTTKPDSHQVAGRRLIRLTNVSQPSITVFSPVPDRNTGTAVLVCPGGGYQILALDLEGTEVCEWLNSVGVTGVLLKYRVPKRAGDDEHVLPLADAQRALRLVRLRAREWNIDPGRIGVLGFSAGGHLAAHLSNQSGRKTYEPRDEADQLSARPDFALPIYPAYLVRKDRPDQLAPELAITADTPPTFLVQTADDGIRVENALFYYLGLKQAKVPAEMHLYAEGGHGYGLRQDDRLVTTWPKRAEEWLRSRGLLDRKG